MDIEEFVIHETKHGPLKEAGWNRHNLRHLFNLIYTPAFHLQDVGWCCDCGDPIWRLRVQPYWLCSLDCMRQINDAHGLDSGTAVQDTGAIGSLHLNQLRSDQCRTGATAISQSDTSSQGNKADCMTRSTDTVETCRYGPDDIVCIDCWLFQRQTGIRRVPLTADGMTSDCDSLSDSASSVQDEYSPFLIHT